MATSPISSRIQKCQDYTDNHTVVIKVVDSTLTYSNLDLKRSSKTYNIGRKIF